MASELTRCGNCGAPLQVGSPACRYCGAPNPGAGAAPAPPPQEISQAIDAIRARMGDPQALLAFLADAISRLDASWVQVQRAVFRSRISRLQLSLGTIHYELRQDGRGCVVERQAVAAGMPVGMKDVVPASRWPDLLAFDVARAADEGGLGWQAVGRLRA